MLLKLGAKWLHARFGFANHLTPCNCVFQILLIDGGKAYIKLLNYIG